MKWSEEIAYAVGLITTDGNLSGDGRHISFVSKDKDQVENFRLALGLKAPIGLAKSGSGRYYFRVQFSNAVLYRWLISIGLSPNKSKTLGKMDVPENFIPDFLRGHLDGDGSLYEYNDPRWPKSYLCYTSFVSASKQHVEWLQKIIQSWLNIHGHITKAQKSSVYQLKYAKKESALLLPALYYSDTILALSRKRVKATNILQKISASGEMVYTQP